MPDTETFGRDETTPDIDLLRQLIRLLRERCPWDREQRLSDTRAYLIEEAHELAAAIDEAVVCGDGAMLSEELGDLLFQAVFVAVVAEEQGLLTLAGSIRDVHRKMVERHPHVFVPSGASAADADAVRRLWEEGKRKRQGSERKVLSGVPASLPALTGAYRMSQKAAGVGFDWPGAGAVLQKVEEELAEVRQALASSGSRAERARIGEEIGDLLLAIANLARHLSVDPEAALALANRKFRRRFEIVEQHLDRLQTATAQERREEMERLWEEAKAQERDGTEGTEETAPGPQGESVPVSPPAPPSRSSK